MWGEFWSTLGAVGLALLVACTALNLLAAAWLARRSLPKALEIILSRAKADSLTALAKVEEIEAQVKVWRTELEGLIEEAENQFGRVERKRASAAAAASRLEARAGGNGASTGEPPPGASREERMRWVRSLAGRPPR